jgi:hypothetical protein
MSFLTKPRKIEALLEIKKLLFERHRFVPDFWYANGQNQGLGTFNPLTRKLADPELQEAFRKYDEADEEDEVEGRKYDQKISQTWQDTLKEISDTASRPAKPLTAPDTKEEWDERITPKSEEWRKEIEESAFPNRRHMSEAILLAPKPISAQANWSTEIYTAAQKLLKPGFFDPEFRALAHNFLAKAYGVPAVFTASVQGMTFEGEKILKLEGDLLEVGYVNKNGWEIEDGVDAENLCKTLKDCDIVTEHSHGVRDLAGKVSEVWKEGSIVKWRGWVDDPQIVRLIRKKRVSGVSLGAIGNPLCSECREPYGKIGDRFIKKCDCEGGHIVVKNPVGQEISITSRPAYSMGRITKTEEVEENA